MKKKLRNRLKKLDSKISKLENIVKIRYPIYGYMDKILRDCQIKIAKLDEKRKITRNKLKGYIVK